MLFNQKKKAKPQNQKLTRKQKKEINKLVASYKGDGKAHSAQESIPYELMYEDGLCRLDKTHYSKCIEFEDVNYQLAGEEEEKRIFESLCDLYNYFDSKIAIQLSLISRFTNREEWERVIAIDSQEDQFNDIRSEYREMLREQRSRGNNGLVKTKYVTLTIEAENEKAARSKLGRIETDVLNHFKVIGSSARVLKGKQRLQVLHGIKVCNFTSDCLYRLALVDSFYMHRNNDAFFCCHEFCQDSIIQLWRKYLKKGYIPLDASHVEFLCLSKMK